MTGSHGGLCLRLRDLARFGMLYTPNARRVTSDDLITAEHVRRIQCGEARPLHRDRTDPLAPDMTAAYGPALPPSSHQWNFVTADGDLFKVCPRPCPVRPGWARRSSLTP